MMAEYERAKILERSRRGKRYAAKAGVVNVLGGAPYGYRYIGKYDAGGLARYEVVEAQAEVVRQIFAWVALDRCSIGQVCRQLQEREIPSPVSACPSMGCEHPFHVDVMHSVVNAMSRQFLASSAIRCCFVDTGSGLGVPGMFPSNSS